MKIHRPNISGWILQFPLILLALSGTILIFLSTKNFGAGISNDSVHYIAVARNLIAGRGFISFDNLAMTRWPPFYPMVLALSGFITHRDPLSLPDLINAVLFGLTIYATGILMLKFYNIDPLISLFGSAAVLFSIPLYSISIWAWSEPLYIFLQVLALICMQWYLSKKKTLPLLLLALFAGCGALTRYLGVTLILWGAIVLALKQDELRQKIRNMFIFLFISTLPLGIWLSHYFPLSQTGGSKLSFIQVIFISMNIIPKWFFPGNQTWQIIIGSAALIIFFGLVWFNRKILRILLKNYLTIQWPVFIYIALFFLILMAATQVGHPDINGRMLSPVYIPLVLIFSVGTAVLIAGMKENYSSRLIYAPLTLLFLVWVFIIFSGFTLIGINNSNQNGRGLNSNSNRESDVIVFIKTSRLDKECSIYTNYREALYIRANLQSDLSLSKTEYNKLVSLEKMSGGQVNWPQKKACLVWFKGIVNNNLLPIKELQGVTKLVLLKTLKYGTIYAFKGGN